MLKCPYDVPQVQPAKGIVRKCDMCSDRLAVGEAPACVQACPNEAIRITLVEPRRVRRRRARRTVPARARPSRSRCRRPTTTRKRAVPANLLPADYYRVRPQHAALPLVVMLVLTQLSVGRLRRRVLAAPAGADVRLVAGAEPVHARTRWSRSALGLLALAASMFHLGRPLYAFRAVLGLRTSWLSREIAGVRRVRRAGDGCTPASLPWRSALCGIRVVGALLSGPTRLGWRVVAAAWPACSAR